MTAHQPKGQQMKCKICAEVEADVEKFRQNPPTGWTQGEIDWEANESIDSVRDDHGRGYHGDPDYEDED